MHKIYEDKFAELYHGDAFECIESIPDNVIQCVITSPTYWGKRSFTDDEREIGSESLEDYVDRNVMLYQKILLKMRKEGSLFIVIQDSFMGSGISRSHHNHWEKNKNPEYIRDGLDSTKQGNTSSVTAYHKIIKNKSLCGIPFRIAIKLVDLGFIWRELIIWEKPNPMPENVQDRLRQSCEYILHFVKNRIYTFNPEPLQVFGQGSKYRMANQVLVASPEPIKGHTATFPRKIVERLLLATTNPEDVVFEPFLGSGTMYYLSRMNNRKFIGIDICRDFVETLAKKISNNVTRYKEKKESHNLMEYLEENKKKNREEKSNVGLRSSMGNNEKNSAIEKRKRLQFFDTCPFRP